MRTAKDWDAILAEESLGEDSDEHDEINVRMVQRNAKRVAELLHQFVPGLDPSQGGDTPLGMNSINSLKSDLSKAARDVSRRSSETTQSASPNVATSPQAGEVSKAAEEALAIGKVGVLLVETPYSMSCNIELQ